MTTRTISLIEESTTEMVGVNRIKQSLPTRNIRQVDPFLLVHHLLPVTIQPGTDIRIPPHPHAGFEVMTYLMDGEFFHRDSRGHEVIAKSGDVNWMTSGNGIVHSEGPSGSFLEKGGKLQLLQIWINLPADKKTLPATFHHYDGKELPVVNGENSQLKIVLGQYEGKTSPVVTQTPMYFYHINLKKDQLFTLPVNDSYTSAVYLIDGKLKVLNQEVKATQLVNFNTDGDQLVFSATEDAALIVFGGLPIKEKVVSYGPFVMNSFEEIQQAIADYEMGKMGMLEF
jgi:redox-sensitive bicupin YhaK (pirin superfamily)